MTKAEPGGQTGQKWRYKMTEMNILWKVEGTAGEGSEAFVTCPAYQENKFRSLLDKLMDITPGAHYTQFSDRMDMEDLPRTVQDEVKVILQDYDRCQVTYENGWFLALPGSGVYSKYPLDFFVCGDYRRGEQS